MDTVEKNKNKDRVTLTSESSVRLDLFAQKLSDMTEGLVCLSKSQIVDFIISELSEEISQRDLKKIRERYTDSMSLIEWTVEKMKLSRADNRPDDVKRYTNALESLVQNIKAQAQEGSLSVKEKTIRAKRKNMRKDGEEKQLETLDNKEKQSEFV